MKIAITTTVRNAGPLLESFVHYHLAIGFDRIYLFFDDQNDLGIETVKGYQQVRSLPVDSLLRLRWEKMPCYSFAKHHIDDEVMARQMLNADLALEMAREEQIEWLLHIDIDELFFVPKSTPKALFSKLRKERPDCVSFLNYEAIPHTPDVKNGFVESSFFRKNPNLLSVAQKDFLNDVGFSEEGHPYFWYYTNGKSAAFVTGHTRSNGVHLFLPDAKKIECAEAIILHYPICGFDQFWNKYKDLGSFADSWFGKHKIRMPIHLKGRELISTNNRTVAQTYYNEMIHYFNDRKDSMLEQGVLAYYPMPAELLNHDS